MVLKLRKEKSSSISGKHALYENVFLITREKVLEAEPYKKEKTKPLYKKGEAYEIYLRPHDYADSYIAHVRFIRNPRKFVKGSILIYDEEGRLRLKAVYRKLKIRRSKGDKELEWAVRQLMDHLKLPVKRYNLSTGSE